MSGLRKLLGCATPCLTLVALLVSCVPARAAVTYQITDLGKFPGALLPEAYAINDRGEVTGGYYGASGLRPFVWSAQTGMRDIGVPLGFSARGIGINESGQIAVHAYHWDQPGQDYHHAFRWTSGSYQDIGTLGGKTNVPHGIDDSGRIVGYSHTSGGGIHAYRSTTGTGLTNIDSWGRYSLGYGTNASGEVVGQVYSLESQYHAFLWSGSGPMRNLGTLGGTQSRANDISDNGIIVGDSSTAGNASYHAFVLQNGKMTDLGSLGSGGSYGIAVNNAGQVIGTYTEGSYGHPYVWDRMNGMHDLNSLLDPVTGSEWTLYYVNDINNVGQIVGQGRHDGDVRAFLLTPILNPAPIPEPASIVLWAGMLALGLVCFKRSRHGKACQN